MAIAKVTINDLIKYREEIEQLTEVLNEAQNGIERLEKADRDIQKEIGEYEKASNKCDGILSELKDKLRQLEAKKRKLEQEIQRLKAEIGAVNAEINALQAEMAELMAELAAAPPFAKAAIMAELAEARERLADCRARKTELQHQLSEAQQELERTKQNIETARRLIEEAEQEKSKIGAGLQNLNAASNDLRSTIRELNGLLQQLLRDSRHALECLRKSQEYINRYIGIRLDGAQYASYNDLSCSETRNAVQFRELRSDYHVDLLKRSEYSKTINVSYLMEREWHKILSEQNGIRREEFGFIKNDLIKEWEKRNGIPWPTYKEDVYSPSGKLIRRAGDKYDAHHLQPLTYGGENESINLTPLHALEHFDKQGIHATDSPFGKIEKFYKET